MLTKGYAAFFYPPPFLGPLRAISAGAVLFSLAIFLGVTGMAFLGTVWWILRTPWAVAAALAFPLVTINEIAGQNAFLQLRSSEAASWTPGPETEVGRRNPSANGHKKKPHLAVAVPIALIISRRWVTSGFRRVCRQSPSSHYRMRSSVGMSGQRSSQAHSCRVSGWSKATSDSAKMQSPFALARWVGVAVIAAYAVQGFVSHLQPSVAWYGRDTTASAAHVEKALIIFVTERDTVHFALRSCSTCPPPRLDAQRVERWRTPHPGPSW